MNFAMKAMGVPMKSAEGLQQTIDGHRVQVLGSGSYGVARLVEGMGVNGSGWVLKSMAHGDATFLGEVSALMKLRGHEGFQQIVGVSLGQQWTIVSHYAGVSLNAWIRENAATPTQLCHVAQQLVANVTRLHHLGLAHNDINGANVCVSVEGADVKVNLIDFGLAKIASTDLVESDWLMVQDVVHLIEMQGQDLAHMLQVTTLDDDMEAGLELELDEDLQMGDAIGCAEGLVPGITITLGPNMEELEVKVDSTINRILKW